MPSTWMRSTGSLRFAHLPRNIWTKLECKRRGEYEDESCDAETHGRCHGENVRYSEHLLEGATVLSSAYEHSVDTVHMQHGVAWMSQSKS